MVPLLSEIKGPADQEITASGQNDLSLTVLKWGAHTPHQITQSVRAAAGRQKKQGEALG